MASYFLLQILLAMEITISCNSKIISPSPSLLVTRFNNAPTGGHSRDVGNKTSIRIVNSQVCGGLLKYSSVSVRLLCRATHLGGRGLTDNFCGTQKTEQFIKTLCVSYWSPNTNLILKHSRKHGYIL